MAPAPPPSMVSTCHTIRSGATPHAQGISGHTGHFCDFRSRAILGDSLESGVHPTAHLLTE